MAGAGRQLAVISGMMVPDRQPSRIALPRWSRRDQPVSGS
jgi:hypothetical protein